ncbi:NAD(P)-dependent alcohol dehydrogenase [Kineosporia mesophila]|uniref:alcohol dehydrogenase (NADP(+)) n=1 Tax=Kineosporia mesophila TaxID=566012 RepID=A0ABP6ZA13_9ACTN|nr:NAD(P)-dependent alcohol dehydrogenase [Kineosporia mesophila]MCD5354815.1 NAD(P)-dependent alcohol dehydrogenase [Kineosporia mesophila]
MRTTTGWEYVPSDNPTNGNSSTALRRGTFQRRDLREDDLAVRIDYCGVCHSDLHMVNGMLKQLGTALVPGHEFTGTVTEVGPAVTGFAVGDQVAVGTLVDSCGQCTMCRAGQENYCAQGPVVTYGGTDRVDGSLTQGGYSREYVLREKFAYRLPAGLDAAGAAPLMCAGVTMWEPLRAAGIGPGSQVAVAGLGGLGHLGVKLSAALGAQVTVLSRTPAKADDAARLGATGLLVTTDEEQLKGARGRFDLVLDSIPGPHELSPLLHLLGLDGTLAVVGYPRPAQVNLFDLVAGRRKLTSSGTGGRTGTADMLAFCAEHAITAEVQVLPSARVNEALQRLAKGDVRYRFVLDLADLDDLDAPAH